MQEEKAEAKGNASGDASRPDSAETSTKTAQRREAQTQAADPVLERLEEQQRQLEKLRRQNRVILKRMKASESHEVRTESSKPDVTQVESDDILTWIFRS